MIVLEAGDGLVDAEVGPGGERDESDVEAEAGLLHLADELGELGVGARTVEDLER